MVYKGSAINLPQSIGEVAVIKHIAVEIKMMACVRQSIRFFAELFHLRLKVFLLFLLYGLFTGIAVFLLQFFGSDFLAWVRGEAFLNYDSQPAFFKWLQRAVALLPWVAVVIIGLWDLQRRNITRSLAFAVGNGMVYMALFFYLFLWPSFQEYFNRQEFDSNVWKNATFTTEDQPVRQQMVDDLLKRYPLVGMTRSQIDALLGVPAATNYFKGFDYVYLLGPERGFFGIDSEFLRIKFKDNRVIEVKILTD